MKAAVFKARNEMAVVELPMPAPGPGEVLLKVHACGICGSDLHAVQYGLGMPPGTVMGHEFSGEIHALGPGVSGARVGERVTSLPYIACGECEACRRGAEIRCERIRGLGLGQLAGAYAEYVVCGAGSLFKLPDNLSSRQGALVEPLSVGLRGVDRGEVCSGTACVVMGAGPIGLATLLWCKAAGADTVVVSELAPGRTEIALRLGATAVVNPTHENPADRVRTLAGRAPDVVFECIGAKGTLQAALEMAAVEGRVTVLGVCMEPDEIAPMTGVLKELRLDFALAYTRADFQQTIDALASGKIDAAPMITDVIGIDAVPEMFQTLRKPSSQAKVLVEFPH